MAKKAAKQKKPRVVPENFVKKAARDAAIVKALVEARKKAKAGNTDKRKAAAAAAEKYAKEYKEADAALVKSKRDAKKAGSFFVEGEAKIAFVIRLRQIHNGVFVKLNKATWNMIRQVEDLITYGFPSRATVRKLIYARGYGKVNRSRFA